MSEENMVTSLADIQNAILHPDFIKHLHGLNISNQWGEVNGRRFLLDVYRLCEKQEELLRKIEGMEKK